MTISVIIPVYKGGEAFRRCLNSLKQFASPNVEIIVVADGDDESGDVAESWGAKVVRNFPTSGPAKARNLGAKIATGDILFFIDADVTVNENTLPQVELLFSQEPDLAAAIGSYDDEPGAANFLSQYKNLFHHYTHQTGSEEASTFWGACGAIRRNIFLEMGGFDESYRLPCVEDIELGYRLKTAGYQIRLCKTLQVKHLKRWEIVSLLKADVFYRAIPWTTLILRYSQLKNDLNLQWSSRISVMLVYSLLASLIATFWWTAMWAFVLGICIALLTINFSVYRFFYHRKGTIFTLRMILGIGYTTFIVV
ncbi:glycosyltransferase family 2 protein [Chroococcus sp. FPU101]|uniref:glycosyltransferase family 2 protein n=1 Tax=Chroococcus sp. FPU101 TaxID=1974212 RepID=UPI001AABF991|nr:glycosyltransferase family 2 protein [Chroococcus sp. FPU101]GFE67654.1 glycosyl transferase family 2 [Chroococcus sp. FPU101]